MSPHPSLLEQNPWQPPHDVSRARRRRPAFFSGYWTNPATGGRLGRVTRVELAEAWRLWAAHRDIREGRSGR